MFKAWLDDKTQDKKGTWLKDFMVTQEGQVYCKTTASILPNAVLIASTGFKDKKGTPIYDRDIFEHTAASIGFEITVRGKVNWSKEQGAWVVNGEALSRNLDGHVLGNDLDNPELLTTRFKR